MSNFWADRLSGGATPEPQRSLPNGYMPSPFYTPPQPSDEAPAAPQQDVIVEPPQTPVKALSTRSLATCPECGSGDFFKPHGQPNMMAQCYTCGWNPRFAHSTAGAGLPGGESAGPATPTRQRGAGSGEGGRSNFHSGADGDVFAHI